MTTIDTILALADAYAQLHTDGYAEAQSDFHAPAREKLHAALTEALKGVHNLHTPAQPIPFSGADESPPVFARRWKLARDGFGVQRDDADGCYVHIDDALSVLHATQAAQPVREPTAGLNPLWVATHPDGLPQPVHPAHRLANAVLDLMTPEGGDVSDIGAQPVREPKPHYKMGECPECNGEGESRKWGFDDVSSGWCQDCNGTGKAPVLSRGIGSGV